MSAQIKYAYLKDQTWLYRRNYPAAVALVLGSQALKRSLKTGDVRLARERAAEVNTLYEAHVRAVQEGAQSVAQDSRSDGAWEPPSRQLLARVRSTLEDSGTFSFEGVAPVAAPSLGALCRTYLLKRQQELRPGGFKSVRYSGELLNSRYGDLPITALGREEGKEFLALISQLSPLLGKSANTYGLSLDAAVAWSRGKKTITPQTQRRIWSQVTAFLDWVVYEGHLEQNPFRKVRFDQRLRRSPYAVPTDEEVERLLRAKDRFLQPLLLICLLTGMRSGEAVGLTREDLVEKGNLGWFFHVRANDQRLLKTEAAERLVPAHSVLLPVLSSLPTSGPLFPNHAVNLVTKAFARLRKRLGLERPGLVFHSTRKWFITQCERTGVPEHWTASLVGHKSARSENGLTYGIYSAGISDEQKRGIVDQIRLPEGLAA